MQANEFYEKYGRSSFGGRIAAEAWLRYEKTLKEEKAADDKLTSLAEQGINRTAARPSA